MSLFGISCNVSVSMDIAAPASKVRPHISTFAAQQVRSPRLIQERTAKVRTEGTDGTVGSSSHREGERIGSGAQTIENIEAEKSLHTTLTFLTPWKSHATAQIELTQKNDIATVTRHMQSELPFFMFWMKGTMITMISKDYKTGLTMLKDLLETGKLATETIYEGETQAKKLIGIGIANAAHQDQMSQVMGADYGQLTKFCKEHKLSIDGGFSMYTKSDMKKGTFEFNSCFIVDPIHKDTLDLPEYMSRYETTPGKSLKVTHKGSYTYMNNSWSALYGAAMNLKKKVNKKAAPYEVYITDPRTSQDPEEFVTEIYLPLK